MIKHKINELENQQIISNTISPGFYMYVCTVLFLYIINSLLFFNSHCPFVNYPTQLYSYGLDYTIFGNSILCCNFTLTLVYCA